MYVDPDHHRRGVGRLLMGRAIEWIRDAGAGATLWTLRDVPGTRRFYEAMGWWADGAAKTVTMQEHPLHHVRYRFDG